MLFVVIFIVCSLTGFYTLPIESEPKCSSKFDFEEKLLEKMVRQEFLMETIQKKVESDLRKFTDDNNHFILQFQTLEDSAEKTLADIKSDNDKDMKSNFDILKDKADTTLTDIKENAEKKLADIKSDYDQDMISNFDILKDKADATLTDIKENAEKKLADIKSDNDKDMNSNFDILNVKADATLTGIKENAKKKLADIKSDNDQDMKSNFDILKDKVDATLTDIKETAEKKLADIKSDNDKDMNSNFDILNDKADATLTHIKENAEKKLADIKSDNDNDMNSNFDILNDKADATLTDIKENAEKKLSEIKDLAVKKDVVFHVRDITAQPTTNNVIKFTKAMTNTDNVYNMDTGYFTAQRNGTYWFAAQICTHPRTYLSPSFYIRGNVVNKLRLGDMHMSTCSTVTAISILQTGDTATLIAGPPIAIGSVVRTDDRDGFNMFMGSLVN